MIVEADALVEMSRVVGLRMSIAKDARLAALRVSVLAAENLAEHSFESPAALVYALARNPSAFAAFFPMCVAAAHLQARTASLMLTAGPREIADTARAARDGEMSYEDVRTFFSSRTLPFGG